MGITIILVTHDQEEAPLRWRIRIGVMNLGRLLEVGRPDELYTRPATRLSPLLGGGEPLAGATDRRWAFVSGTTALTRGLRVAGSNPKSAANTKVVAVLRPGGIGIGVGRATVSRTHFSHGDGAVETVLPAHLERLRCAHGQRLDVTDFPHQAEPAILE